MPANRTLRFAILIIALTAIFMTLLATTAASLKPEPSAAVVAQQIDRLLKRHESLKLDAAETARRVRESGRLLLTTPTQSFDLDLVPNDLRAANYRAEEVTDGGVVQAVQMETGAPIQTFRGTVRGLRDAEARFTITDEKIEGVIITAAERYYVEPLRNYTNGSSATDYIFYKGSDVVDGAQGFCGTTMDGKLKAEVERLSSQANETLLATSNRQVDLATEADFEFVSFFNGSAAANTEILNTMNQVDGLYQAEMGVTFRIVYQHTWADNSDPYSSTVSDNILTEFTNYWNANISQPRDLAHMWTGKPVDANVVGIAWMSTLCANPSFAYGLSVRVNNISIKSSITAHEIGHNLGASHPDQEAPPVTACASTIMNSFVGQTFVFCQFSLDQMNNYLSTHSSCLTDVGAATNPLDDAQFFVQQHYRDFLSRDPDQSGLNFWTGQITGPPACALSDPACLLGRRVTVSNAFFFEQEFQQTGAYVFRLYRAAFGNNQPFPNPDATNPAVPGNQQAVARGLPSYAKFASDRAALIGSVNLAQDQQTLANAFVARPEFLTKYPNSTLSQFVDAIVANTLAADGADLSSQKPALIALGTRGAVIYRLVNDDLPGGNGGINNRAFIDSEYNRSFAATQYFGYLRRDADIGGFGFWLSQVNLAPLRDTTRQRAMVCTFVTSTEYQQRFSLVVTHSNAECP